MVLIFWLPCNWVGPATGSSQLAVVDNIVMLLSQCIYEPALASCRSCSSFSPTVLTWKPEVEVGCGTTRLKRPRVLEFLHGVQPPWIHTQAALGLIKQDRKVLELTYILSGMWGSPFHFPDKKIMEVHKVKIVCFLTE